MHVHIIYTYWFFLLEISLIRLVILGLKSPHPAKRIGPRNARAVRSNQAGHMEQRRMMRSTKRFARAQGEAWNCWHKAPGPANMDFQWQAM